MAKLSIDIPDAADTHIIAKLAKYFGYQNQIMEGGVPGPGPGGMIGGTWVDNPETKKSYVRRKVADYLKNICVQVDVQTAEETARTAARDQALIDNDLPQVIETNP